MILTIILILLFISMVTPRYPYHRGVYGPGFFYRRPMGMPFYRGPRPMMGPPARGPRPMMGPSRGHGPHGSMHGGPRH